MLPQRRPSAPVVQAHEGTKAEEDAGAQPSVAAAWQEADLMLQAVAQGQQPEALPWQTSALAWQLVAVALGS